MAQRDSRGRFANSRISTNTAVRHVNLELGRLPKETTDTQDQADLSKVFLDHDYINKCGGQDATTRVKQYLKESNKKINLDWREGRYIIELGELLDNLRYCQHCGLGPVPLTSSNLIAEMPCGLGGYFYVLCTNISCQKVNRAAYGKTHRTAKTGMPSFAINTKLGLGKIIFHLLTCSRGSREIRERSLFIGGGEGGPSPRRYSRHPPSS